MPSSDPTPSDTKTVVASKPATQSVPTVRPSQPQSTAGAFLIAAAISLTFAALIVVVALVVNGVDTATRTATSLCMPIGVLWLALLTFGIATCLRGYQAVGAIFVGLFLFLWVTASSVTADRMISLIEWHEGEPNATPEDPYQTAVVLGGATSVRPGGTREVNEAGERVVSAAQLWHAGLTRSIVATGSSPDGKYHNKDVTAELLVSLGVPEDVIFKIDGQNTSQEMKYLKSFLKTPPVNFPDQGSPALITSAFHMRRALRLARSQGLELDPHAVGFSNNAKRGFSPSKFVPDAGSVRRFSMALKELLAEIVGR